MERILAYNLRSRFFPDIQFSQNHIANYGASIKAQKLMLPSLKCQLFCFWSKFVSFTQFSRQQIQFSKYSLCHFLVNMAKYPHAKNLKIQSGFWGKCVTDGRTDRWTDEQKSFYRTPSAKMELSSCFSEIRE